jgi:WD40 repeat protein
MSSKSATRSAAKLARADAQRIFDTLPATFQGSVVGNVYQQAIRHLNDEGMAPLEPLIALLFPGTPPAQARRELSTRYINRPPTSADGRVLLQLRMSRANAQAATPGTVWFEAQATLNPADFTPDNPTYTAKTFVEMQATRATGQQIGQALEAVRLAPEVAREMPRPLKIKPTRARSDDVRLAMAETALSDYPARRTLHGLRKGPESGHFEHSAALRVEGMDAGREELDLPGVDHAKPGNASNATRRMAAAPGTTVNCLDAMLQWAAAQGEPSHPQHRLLALLGDYGTGKTSHCFQFTRVLNGGVAHEAWMPHPQAPTKPSTFPEALYIDLAELAGNTNLAALSLPDILTVVLNKAAAGEGSVEDDDVQALVQRARAGSLIMVFDGLDELLKNDRSVLHKVFDQLLKVLEPSKAQKEKGQPSLARVIVSCRTHYFRDVEDQHGFFNTRQRGVARAGDYLCLNLLPWTAANITSYLGKRLPPAEAAELLHIINTTYNLQELASRPVLLAMMSEQLGNLLRLRDAGEPITAARLYDITVSEWVQRDSGKHRLAAQHKAVLMGALAAAMWSEGVEAWSAEQLDRWLLHTAQMLFPQRYAIEQAEAIQDDLRTATFIVRPDAQRFSFAHRSFLEYFLARFVWDALALCEMDALSDADLRHLLPTRALNAEAQLFLKEICANQLRRLGTASMRKRALPLVHALQTAPGHAPGTEPLSASQRANLWQLVMDFDVTGETAQVMSLQAAPPVFAAATQALPLNLSGLDFADQQWKEQDFSWLPPLDLRGANLLKLRARHVRFGRVLCGATTNWGQALLRYCDTAGIEWGASDRGGLIVRNEKAEARSPKFLALKVKGRKRGPPVAQPQSETSAQASAVVAIPGPWTLPAPRCISHIVAFHPQGHQVLTGGGDKTARLWDCATGQELRRFGGEGKGHDDRVTSVALHPQGHQVLTGSDDKTIRLWDCATGQELRRFGGEGKGHDGSVTSVAFHPQGHQVLSGSDDKTMRLWDCATGQELRRFGGEGKGHDGSVTSVAFHPQGHHVLTGSSDDTARLWDCATGQELRRFGGGGKGHDNWVTGVAFHPQGPQVLTGSHDSTARLWDCATGQELRRFGGTDRGDGKRHDGWVMSVAFHPQGHQVLTGSNDDTARLWDCATGQELRRFGGTDRGNGKGHGNSVTSVAFHPQGHQVLTGSHDETARLWDCATGQELRRFGGEGKGHGGSITSVAFHPQGHQVLTGSNDTTARLWDCATGQELRRFGGEGKAHDRMVTSVAFHPQGHRVLTGSRDNTSRLWDCATGQELRRFGDEGKGHGRSVTSVAFHPQGHQVLTGSHDETARLWDCATGQELRRFGGEGNRHGGSITSVAFHPHGHQVLTGSNDTTARLWDCATGQELRRFGGQGKGHNDWVRAVAFHPQGHQMLTGSHDKTARLWDCATGQELRRFGGEGKGHGRSVTSVAFHPQGHQVLTGSYDETARLWDCFTGQELRRFEGEGKGHDGHITSVAFHPEGDCILTGSSDGSARLWSGIDSPDQPYTTCRLFVHGAHGPSTAEFDVHGNLLDFDDEAIDTWLFTLAHGKPEPLEMAPTSTSS